MGFLLDTRGLGGVKLLLLLNILVMKASADCSRPVAPDEMVLTDTTLLRSDFPEGVSVTLDCFDGYDRISGTGLTTCTDGEWSQPDLVCTMKDCGRPPPQPNMIFDLRGGTMLGDIIKVTCEEGYQIRGTSYKQCYAFGWFGWSKCVVKNCGNPVSQPNMTVSIPSGTLYGAEIEVFCDKGYKLIGSRKRKCEAKGWSGSARCEIIRCKAPGELANGRSSWDSQEYPTVGQTVHYVCNEGYALNGTDAIVCKENGEYDRLPPTCLVSPFPDSTAAPTALNKYQSTREQSETHGDGSTANLKDEFPTMGPGYSGIITFIVVVAFFTLGVCIVVALTVAVVSKRIGSYDFKEGLKMEPVAIKSLKATPEISQSDL